MKALAASEAALAAGDVEGAARALLLAWREVPHADLADALDRFPSRPAEPPSGTSTEQLNAWVQRFARAGPLDVPPLLDALEVMLKALKPRFTRPCLDALAVAVADPRVGARLAKLAPIGERALSGPFNAALWRHASMRELEKLKALVAATGNGKFKQIRFTVEKRASGLVLEPEVRVRVRELGAAAVNMAAPAASSQSGASLLERVWAAPDDPMAREVFRDWLLERGDPWGELMALQEHRVRTGGEETPRERALLRKVRPQILGSLAGAKGKVLSELQFERGFVVGATVMRKGVTRVAALLSRPELSTLERVRFVQDAALTPNLHVLREVHGVHGETLGALVKKAPELKVEVLSMVGGPGFLEGLEVWPTLAELSLTASDRLSELFRSVRALEVLQRLTAFGARGVYARLAFDRWSWEALDGLPAGIQRVTVETMWGLDVRFVFERASDGWSVHVSSLPVRNAGVPLDVGAVKAAATVLREAKAATFDAAFPAELRTALGG
ncbi:MAG: hypothetical protein JNK82_07795 [Myxococcaceae bacterium]|nr:hypothetical protein [Myxococcaceae bacterium]